MSETTKGRECCCIFCKCVEGNKHIFKNNVLIKIHKCKFADILLEAQNSQMCGRIKLKQNTIYNKYMEKHKDDIEFKTKEINQKEKHIIGVRVSIS